MLYKILTCKLQASSKSSETNDDMNSRVLELPEEPQELDSAFQTALKSAGPVSGITTFMELAIAQHTPLAW